MEPPKQKMKRKLCERELLSDGRCEGHLEDWSSSFPQIKCRPATSGFFDESTSNRRRLPSSFLCLEVDATGWRPESKARLPNYKMLTRKMVNRKSTRYKERSEPAAKERKGCQEEARDGLVDGFGLPTEEVGREEGQIKDWQRAGVVVIKDWRRYSAFPDRGRCKPDR